MKNFNASKEAKIIFVKFEQPLLQVVFSLDLLVGQSGKNIMTPTEKDGVEFLEFLNDSLKYKTGAENKIKEEFLKVLVSNGIEKINELSLLRCIVPEDEDKNSNVFIHSVCITEGGYDEIDGAILEFLEIETENQSYNADYLIEKLKNYIGKEMIYEINGEDNIFIPTEIVFLKEQFMFSIKGSIKKKNGEGNTSSIFQFTKKEILNLFDEGLVPMGDGSEALYLSEREKENFNTDLEERIQAYIGKKMLYEINGIENDVKLVKWFKDHDRFALNFAFDNKQELTTMLTENQSFELFDEGSVRVDKSRILYLSKREKENSDKDVVHLKGEYILLTTIHDSYSLKILDITEIPEGIVLTVNDGFKSKHGKIHIKTQAVNIFMERKTVQCTFAVRGIDGSDKAATVKITIS